MDESLLAGKGIEPSEAKLGFLDGYGLRIGERATLIREPNRRAWGVVMEISSEEATSLYAEESVADYVSEPVSVELMDGKKVEAFCYNLPPDKVTGTNREYAEALLKVAAKLKFPDTYLEQIRQAGE